MVFCLGQTIASFLYFTLLLAIDLVSLVNSTLYIYST